MMAEAKKMMDSPEFKKQMKQLEKSKDFKDAQKKAKDMMTDPQSAARMQAQMEHMVRERYEVTPLSYLMANLLYNMIASIKTGSAWK
jgi:hypothetical protein